MSKCAYCDENIRRNEHVVHCDLCGTWTHRTCFTGIKKSQYLAAKKRKVHLPFVCGDCQYRIALQTPSETRQGGGDDVRFFDTGSVARSETVDFHEEEVEVEEEGLGSDDVRFFDTGSVARTETVDFQEEERSDISDFDRESISDEDISEFSGLESETSIDIDDPADDVHMDVDDEESTPEYEIIPQGSSKGKDVLVDRLGYQYTRKPRKTGKTTYWRCVIRNKEQNCRASVIEGDGTFTRGMYEHIHEPTSGGALARRIASKVKSVAKANVFQSAADIAEEIIVEELSDKRYPESLASVANVARAANRHRRRMRPKHPTDLEFELQMEHIPDDFLKTDIRVNSERHLIFATDCMLKQLEKAKTWYVDGTFKVVQKPFCQLFSIHAFMKQNKVVKQVPLCFVIMSAKREEDYRAVFANIREKMSRPPRVKKVISDFEKALWKAVQKEMPDVIHIGCAFHWTQAIRRQMQASTGIRHAYKKRGEVYRVLREVSALPYLPAANIEPLFVGKLKGKLELFGLKEFSDYIHKTWISSKRWSPRAWSVYKQAIRTNNDCEGWHYRLNRKARNANLNMYLLIQLLYNESKMVLITMKMISDRKLRSTRKKKSRTKDARIQEYWKKFDRGRMGPEELLRACAYIPRLATEEAEYTVSQ